MAITHQDNSRKGSFSFERFLGIRPAIATKLNEIFSKCCYQGCKAFDPAALNGHAQTGETAAMNEQ
jgi:hypothetical protein